MSETEINKDIPTPPERNEDPFFASTAAFNPVAVSNKPPVWVWASLALLAIVALAVIFVLPSIVDDYELPLERRTELVDAPVIPVSSGSAETQISPFEEAQRSLQRKEAQDVLAELLTVQADLDAIGVQQWAETDYQAALADAQSGDESYRQQDFIAARDAYQTGMGKLQNLTNSIPQIQDQLLVEAQAALLRGDSAQAKQDYSQVLQFEPNNEQAQVGLARAQTLDDVNQLLDDAQEQYEDGALESAGELYQQALNLDSLNEQARSSLNRVNREITENEFSRIMSTGYAFLERGEPDQAIAAFKQATALGINQDQALAAISQTENDIASAQISRLQVSIQAAEAAEQWQSAVSDYQSVLAVDPNLVFAIEGKDYAQKRQQLDQLLEAAVANPLRFSEEAVYQQTLDIYYTGRGIENPGSRLIGQLDKLEDLLEVSQIPIEIQLVSDNETSVTLLRISELGRFEQQSLSLKPGRYVAVGTRSGYRDVRHEFVVGFGQTPATVSVRCDEPVVAARGR